MPTKKKTAQPVKAVTDMAVVEADLVTSEPTKHARCVICGDEVAPFSTEELCWVCRRLKISAWREAEGQIAAQE